MVYFMKSTFGNKIHRKEQKYRFLHKDIFIYRRSIMRNLLEKLNDTVYTVVSQTCKTNVKKQHRQVSQR